MRRLTLAICGGTEDQVMGQLAAIPSNARDMPTLVAVAPPVAERLRSRYPTEGKMTKSGPVPRILALKTASALSGSDLSRILAAARSEYLLLLLPGYEVTWGQRAFERFESVASETGAGIVYSDFRERRAGETIEHPTIDYQLGSIRDDFDFGPVMLLSRRAVDDAQQAHGAAGESWRWGGLYDLRLKIGIDYPIQRIPESLYTRERGTERSDSGVAAYEEQFGYVDSRNRDYQVEMESVASAHLRRIGAYLEPRFRPLPQESEESTPAILASVVIPVRNREKTIADAVRSALHQTTHFPYNILAIDNHSTDRTSEILAELAREHPQVVHRVPDRTGLGIGGCWNEAVYSRACGRYAVQLDSDDLYADEGALERLVALLRQGSYAMVIGSYTLVDFELREIQPGLIAHREWTRENGRNNALRINGLGAPRAFHVPTLRSIGFPDVSYGEDYAVALRISREYEIGRIFESIYLCRRWGGNTDASLPLATSNRYDTYKDRLRTIELMARIKLNAAAEGAGEKS